MNNFEVSDLFRILPLILLLGTLASASGNSHTAVANQARLLITEFHKLRFSDKCGMPEANTHLKILQYQIHIFDGRCRRCAYIHMTNYSALCIAVLVIPSMKLKLPDPLLAMGTNLLFIFVSLMISSMCVLRIQELMMGKDTLKIAADEVSAVKFDGSPQLNSH